MPLKPPVVLNSLSGYLVTKVPSVLKMLSQKTFIKNSKTVLKILKISEEKVTLMCNVLTLLNVVLNVLMISEIEKNYKFYI